MPGSITHLRVAYIYNNISDNRFSNNLYLGAISPDSVNINGHAEKSLRWPAHLRDADLKKWLENATAFYKLNKGKLDEAFLRGYILHIITDIVWDSSFDRPLFEKLYKEGVAVDELKNERWNEIYGYERQQLGSNWLNDVLPRLTDADLMAIGTIDPVYLSVWRKIVLKLDFPQGKLPKFVNEELMQAFFEEIIEVAQSIFETCD